MAIYPFPLFQETIADTSAKLLYRPSFSGRIESIIFVNTHVSSVTVDVYHDIDGEVFDDTTKILSTQTVAAGGRLLIDERWLFTTAGSFGVKVSVADVVNVIGYGWLDDGL